MSIEQLKTDVSKWILDWVSVYNEQLGTVPCPYAKAALLDKKIEWKVAHDAAEVGQILNAIPSNGLANDVLVIGINRDSVDPGTLSYVIRIHNQMTLMPNNFVALEDHPDDEETINGVVMNQGTWALVMIQELSKINKASKMLEAQGYYNNWSKNELDDVVTWRFK